MSFLLNPHVFAGGAQTLLQVITSLGLTTNLKVCLDAGDGASWPGSGQKWLDTSGNGHDFFLGADGSATATDPTFNGSAGGLSGSEYWSFDAGDYFTYDAANEAWMETLHKDNAIFSFCGWIWFGTAASTQVMWATNTSTLDVGALYRLNGSGNQALLVGTSPGIIDTSAWSLSDAQWAFLGVSINEATGASGGFHYLDGTSETFTSTYSSPSAGSAVGTFHIGSTSAGNSRLTSGSRLAEFAFWQGTKLSTADFDAIYAATRTRFGV